MLEDHRSTARCATAAVDFMDRHAITPNPRNYALWYAYESGANPELCRAIEGLRQKGEQLDDETSERLYEQFLSLSQPLFTIEQTGDEMSELLHQTRADLEDAGLDTEAFGHTLSELSDDLADAEEIGDLKLLINSIVVETQRMETRNRDLEARLGQTSENIGSLNQRLEAATRESLTDGLTDLGNRKAFDDGLKAETALAESDGTPLCLIMMDIDHFKTFNDDHGHLLGDQVLKLVAKTLVANLKGRDCAARYGGEEFAVILPKTALLQGIEVAEMLRVRMSESKLTRRVSGEEIGRITLSLGVAAYRPGEHRSDLLDRADAALYAAKNGGRNRVASELDLN